MLKTNSKSYAWVRDYIESFGWKLLSPESAYSGWSNAMRMRCRCGKEVLKAPSLLAKAARCSTCRGGTYDDAVKLLREAGWKPLFSREDYTGISRKHKAQCPCGNITTKEPSFAAKHPGCSQCRLQRASVGRRTGTYDEAVAEFRKHGWKPLFERADYAGWGAKLRGICSCGATSEKSPSLISKAPGCLSCMSAKQAASKIAGSYAEAVTLLNSIGWKAQFKESEYEGISKYVKVQCKCGNKLEIRLQRLPKSGTCAACKHTAVANQRSVTTRDGKFNNIGEAASYYGINRGSLTSRLRMGWSDEEACGLVPREIDRASRDPEATGCIYRIRNTINGLVYIGLTSVSPEARWKGHRRESRSKSTAPLHNAIREFGASSFEIVKLMDGRVADLPELERKMIRKYRSDEPRFGYNGCAGGGLGGPTLGHQVVYKRQSYVSRRSFADAIGASYELVRRLFAEGLTPHQVFKEAKKRSERGYHMKREIVVQGKRYASLKEACAALGVTHDAVQGRIRLGWPIERAFTPGKFTKATSPMR